MKKLLIISFVFALLNSCSSDSDPDQIESEVSPFPAQWVLTKDESIYEQDPSVARYSYIYTNKSAMFRDDILKSYPLEELVKEEHCLWYVSATKSSDKRDCYTIQLDDDPILFLGVGPSTNHEEVHLYIQSGVTVIVVGNPSYIAPPYYDEEDGDIYKFFFYKMEDVNGVRTYAIESVGMPGWYISDSPPGFNYAANVMTLQKESSPEGAPKWQGRTAH